MKLFIPADAAAQSVGADEVAERFRVEAAARGHALTIVRTGSRGLFWLEPLVEVQQDGGRHGFSNVTPDDVPHLLEALVTGAAHPSSIGHVDSHPALAKQKRLTFARVGVIDPLSLDEFKASGGFEGWARAQHLSPENIVDEVTQSGLRGRGGAGFPCGIKWKTVASAPPTPWIG